MLKTLFNGMMKRPLIKKYLKKPAAAGRASITVEAALVTPLFIMVVLAFCFFFRLMQVQNMLQNAIDRTAEDIASYGYAYSCADAALEDEREKILSKIPLGGTVFKLLAGYADDYAIKLLTAGYVDKELLESGRVVDGWNGIRFSKSALNDSENCVSIVISYSVEVPLISRIAPAVTVTQKTSAGQFSGKISLKNAEEEAQDKTVVYVTPNGTVYHTSPECTHLMLTTEAVSFAEVGELRNYKQGKYYPCEHCANRRKKPETVWINFYGDRYHFREDCISLRRTVIETTLDQIDLPLCSRCAERDAGER